MRDDGTVHLYRKLIFVNLVDMLRCHFRTDESSENSKKGGREVGGRGGGRESAPHLPLLLLIGGRSFNSAIEFTLIVSASYGSPLKLCRSSPIDNSPVSKNLSTTN